MSESPIINQAARLVREALDGVPADQVLRTALPRSRFSAAPGPWRLVSHAVFAYFRWMRWLEADTALQRRIERALELQRRFDADPDCVKPEALAVRAVPDWIKDEIPAPPVGWLRQLQREPALWIRAKTAAADRVRRTLAPCVPAPFSAEAGLPATAFRYTGETDLFRTAAFHEGLFEIQDLASQLVGHACAPKPGETWWDACAGEGGKTLHLSDLMQNKGLLWASDRSVRRLSRLKTRAARAGMFNYRAASWDGGPRLPTKTGFNGVLVDAPCSGVGTWQRNPHARWTTQPRDVAELAAVQTRLLDHAARALRPGGRLVYSVCTLTRSETVAVADAFSAAHSDFEPATLPLAPQNSPDASRLLLWPHELDANGMFLASWRKR